MSAQVSLELHHRISQFLFHEASLLDDWKFRDWLAQLDEEIRAVIDSGYDQCESPVWKRAWPGQKSRRHAPVT